MSVFMFATCDPRLALRHLKLIYPRHEITEESVKKIMPYIQQDIVRIQDPGCHNPAQVVEGKNWVEDKRKQIAEDFKDFHNSLELKNV